LHSNVKASMSNGKIKIISTPADRHSPDTILELTFNQNVTRIDN